MEDSVLIISTFILQDIATDNARTNSNGKGLRQFARIYYWGNPEANYIFYANLFYILSMLHSLDPLIMQFFM